MKHMKFIAAMLCAVMLTGCDQVKETVTNFIDNDANIGKNAPAVMGTLADFEQLNEEAAESEAAKLTDEEREQIKADEEYAKLKARAEEILSGMGTEDKIGQMLLARFPSDPIDSMTAYHLGGYTMYADDFRWRDVETVRDLTKDISAAAVIAPFFAVDEEGGNVVRISSYKQYRDEPFSSPQALYQRGGTELIQLETDEKAKLLRSMGINLNLAPVADISDDTSSYIYLRTMGLDAEGTAEQIEVIVHRSNRYNLASCLKHFPGYGDNTDTHNGSAHDSRELYEFYNRDFVPFEAGINVDPAKIPAVMVGHTVYDLIDPETPASLSSVIHQTLRDRLEFNGVIITDDMGMDAIKEYAGDKSVYVLGILAGNDMLCVTDFKTAFNDLCEARKSGEITEDMLNEHVLRIIMMKLQYKIVK